MVPRETRNDEPQSDQAQADEMKRGFGRYLQECRLASGRSLDEIAQLTKINRTCLLQIENEALENLPQPVFVEGFLRTYANAVGVDAAEALRRYRNCRGDQKQVARKEKVTLTRTRLWLRLIIGILLLAGAVAISLYVVQKVKSADHERTQGAITKDTSLLEDAPTEKPASVQNNPTGTAAAQKPALDLSVSAVARTRLKIIADAGLPQEFDMQAGEEIAVSADKHFNVLIGNAGGVRLLLNDKPIAIPGKNGQVVTLKLP